MGTEISNETTLHKISPANNTQILDINGGKNNTNNLSENSIVNSTEPLLNLEDSDEEYINDDKLNSILDNIESEISQMNKIRKTQMSTSKTVPGVILSTNDPTKELPVFNSSQMNLHKIDINRQFNGKLRSDLETYANMQKTRKAKNLKSNYSFIDVLEKNDATINEQENNMIDNATGFSSAIKSNIDKYLETIQHSSKDSDNTINQILQNTNNCNLASENMADNATGFSSAIKSNIDKYLETIQHSSKDSDNAINQILQNTNNCNLASENMAQQHNQDDTSKRCHSSDRYYNLNIPHSSNAEISVDIHNLDDIVHESIPEKKLNIESLHTDNELSAKFRTIESKNLINNNTLMNTLQSKTSLIANATDCHNDQNILKSESNIYDTNINNSFINRIDNNSNYESNNNLVTQDSDNTEPLEHEEQRLNEDRFTKPKQHTDFFDSSEINQLSRKLFKIEKYARMTDCIRFTATSVSVRSSKNFVHIIKKLKVNLDISKTMLTNKMINKDTIPITSDQFTKTDDILSMKEPEIATNALLPSVYKAIEQTTEPISTNNYKDLEHLQISQDESNEIENISNEYGNTTPKCFTYVPKETPMMSTFDNLKETACDDGPLNNSGHITEVNKISIDNSINKDLTDLTTNNSKQISESDYIIECDQNKMSAQKCEGNKVADILKKYSTLLRV
ncbi:hypothetical protein O3G_MSEX001349 [Manduca sexta]|uniref:Uncharacterized protein n=1 Tax=Manduca sexta TaxID=7130 RepID=A0A921YK34_MANSE|nr:hypothetical protein O3G_MSEX001349 [Manduca sexta]